MCDLTLKEAVIANGHEYQVKSGVLSELKPTKLTWLVNLLLFNKV
jgi:hypothetical protein